MSDHSILKDMHGEAPPLAAECGDGNFGCQPSSEGRKTAAREDMAVGAINTEGDFGMGGE